MSRLPVPDPGWEESTEGDLDPDLAEEAGSRLEDWDDPHRTRWMSGVRVVSLVLIVVLVGIALAQALLLR